MYCLIIDDSSRVELTPVDDIPGTDYINASYINVRDAHTHTHTHTHAHTHTHTHTHTHSQ